MRLFVQGVKNPVSVVDSQKYILPLNLGVCWSFLMDVSMSTSMIKRTFYLFI